MIEWEQYWQTENRFECRRSGQGVPMECISPGRYRQLFVDNYVIEHQENLEKILHQPIRAEENPVIRPDQPWERRVGYVSVIRDEEEGCFKAWYGTESGTAYAVSDDGIAWEKPQLGILEWEGSRDNNLVMPPIVSGTYFKDLPDADPARRYKCFGLKSHPRYGLYVGYSPDGLNWAFRSEPVLTTENDPGLNDHPTLMHDRLRNRYIAFSKRERINPFANGDWGFIQRMRCVSFSKDFEHFTDPVLSLRADDQDLPDFQVHGLSGFNYQGAYLGLIDAMHSGDVGPMERTIDLQLACSRDGEAWWRAGDRRTFLPLGPPESFDRFLICPAHSPPIAMGDELYIYYTGTARRHRRGTYPDHRRREPWRGPGHPEHVEEGITGWDASPESPITGIGLARLRIDGFVSLDAGSRPGRLLTRPLKLAGTRMHLNADAKAGNIKAEMFEARPVDLAQGNWANCPAWNWAIDQPVQGYSLGNCIGISENTTDGTMRWQCGDRFPELEGRKVVVRFELTNASLYSFWFD